MKTRLLCLSPLLLGWALPGWAACTIPSASAAFGTVSSFSVNTTASTTSTTANLNCGNGSLLSLLTTDYIRLQLTSATFTRNTRGTLKVTSTGTDSIPVQLCREAACTNELTVGGAATNYSTGQLPGLIGAQGGLNFAIPLYLRTVPGEAVAAGSYTVVLNVLVTYNICTGLGLLGACLLGNQQSGSGLLPVTVNMTITNDCTTITAPDISFGSAPLVGSFNSVSQSINVICTKGSTYTVGLSNGGNAQGTQRYMVSGGNRLAYNIFKNATTSRWGPTGSERVASTAANLVSSDGLTRTYNYTARILATQSTPPAGNYSDSVVVDLSF
ncbi:Csu type fimbrial protein [Pantoea sp. FN060301]|uniref:Csu type fimbrial protein n=1 Tax=Pantoea sp. FN060301 TaxID=3420380 RepID=UPI003D17297E